ncbi:MAG: ABC transporter substrate-binding protein [Hyphomicrobium sp.]|uniref:ABC transporter substrate-binding protein n=1 Tax=Hyphomicrobium sp. CS1BSMeth3 TaxID=1892844 RepID=UPI00086E410B|nr:ABC transporter substrate-binding protein [Hyphomicrobium sp. CS1BSMeth3]MBN9260800.1 ABC transporter substrate-binding protein [Hyphomicrobium sp.]MBN9265132.1 ABC transporter substrate-binding protein [Hyphomicrobium sp.]MBN9278149.1 ABC transporter substrate-binding protein [Hyphomicrobium sp.]ODT27420.1 MAG: ABC transporter substrate-binding protein [Hyphomicrobium sp. SCN 65-11]
MKKLFRPTRRALIKGAGATAAVAGISGFPAISRAQADVIRIGHLTPRTGFLGVLGDYAVMAADQAADEINAAGGVLGRKIELLKEDSVNPQTASTKAERMIERDKVACIVGEISSASCLTIAQVAQRTKNLFVNTGGNSDALRGSNCNRYMFHVESQNSMYVKTVGRSLLAGNMVKGKKWYSLTADYAFGHDLLRVAKRFMEQNGGQFAADELVPTDLSDFSSILTKIRNSKPDLVVSNLAGNQITNFLKQYSEFGLEFPVAGFGFDTAVAWGAGKGNFFGTWPLVWHHLIDTAGSKKFVADFTARYKKPPENQAWGDYIALKILAQAMNDAKSIEAVQIIEHLEKEPKFDLLKTRPGYFRKYDHQLMHEMYAVEALKANELKNQWDIYRPSAPVPAPNEPLDVIAATAEENACKMT